MVDQKKQVAALVADINAAQHVSRADADTLAQKHGLSARVVIAKAAAAGKYARDEKKSGLRQRNSGGVQIQEPSRDEQYGVLQPAANLAGGCFNWWLWLILIGLVVAVFVVLKDMITG